MQVIDIETQQFIRQNEIDLSRVFSMLNYAAEQIPSVEFGFDTDTYKEFGVLRIIINYDNKSIQPLLFGTLENLSRLSIYLWKQETNNWNNDFENISGRASFLRREILIPRIVDLFCKYNKKSFFTAEFGCGNGIIIKELIKHSERIHGIDANETFIEKLRSEIPNYKDNLFICDIVKNVFMKKYDIIICSMLLLDIPQIDKALENIFNSLKTDGILIIVDINPNTYKALGFFNGAELVAIHDKDNIFSTEKWISGATKAVHNYHPYSFYKLHMESKGMKCLEDFTFGPTQDLIMNNPRLNNQEQERLLIELEIDIANPLYRCLVLKK